uniref:Ectonucleoside triphosphate diphosphohydrolase 8 n=1 Tax=Chelydra serpentina TaxID=8475 RepID=A0A8C3S256_CHESE
MFLTDITTHLNELNLCLQGAGQTVLDLYKAWKAFVVKLAVFSQDIRTSTFRYFQHIKELSPHRIVSVDEIGMYIMSLHFLTAVDSIVLVTLSLCTPFSMENKSAADQVLSEVAKTIQQYPVNFHGARIITGEEEGAYGWITINYLLDSFTKVWLALFSDSVAKILGALDLGGASTQISFIPIDPITDQTKASKFRLYGFDYTIYTHSYLCYGQNQALKQLILKITESSINHPCYPEGYQETTTAASIHSIPCTASHALTLSQASWNATLVGTGNATACRMAIKQIFNFTACGQSQSCTFNGTYQPPVNGEFFVRQILSDPSSEQSLNPSSLRVTLCLKSSYPTEKEQWLREYCANANYILVLLLDAYKFNQTSWSSIKFQMKVSKANTDIGWTLGYMLNLTNMIPVEAPEQVKGQQNGLWAAAIFFIVLTLGFCLVGLLIYILW